MASRNGKKTSGLRMLWIPGGRKNHPKGRFDSTNKQISYSGRQKKSQVWSLGGSKAQRDLLEADPDISLLDGPSTSGIASIACATAIGSAGAAAATTSAQCLVDSHNSPENQHLKSNDSSSPTTPNSTASTAPLLSPPLSPHFEPTEAINIITQPSSVVVVDNNSDIISDTMPAKSHQPIPVIVTATTTNDIMEENRFSLLGKDIITNELDIYTLPSPPKNNNLNSQDNFDSSSGTTVSQITPSGSPHKTSESHNGSVNNTPVKKKHHHRNHNNNQGDVNSIESITEDTNSEKIPSGDLDWIDTAVQERQDRAILAKPKKTKKKKHANVKELDQLDGVPIKENSNDEPIKEDDEKVTTDYFATGKW